MFIDNENYENNPNNPNNENNLEQEILRCAICYDTIDNINNGILKKICQCRDSLICVDCVEDLKKNLVKKCPVCRSNLDVNISYYTCHNWYVFFNNFKIIISYIIINIFLTNIVIYYVYYSKNEYIPDIMYKDYIKNDDIDNLAKLTRLQQKRVNNVIMLNKPFVFELFQWISENNSRSSVSSCLTPAAAYFRSNGVTS